MFKKISDKTKRNIGLTFALFIIIGLPLLYVTGNWYTFFIKGSIFSSILLPGLFFIRSLQILALIYKTKKTSIIEFYFKNIIDLIIIKLTIFP